MRDKNRIKPFLDELGKIWEDKMMEEIRNYFKKG